MQIAFLLYYTDGKFYLFLFFRPDYRKLNELRNNYPKVPFMALTATATPKVRVDIKHQLGLVDTKL